MTDKDRELLSDLLLRWEELFELGQDTPASELSKEHPHLIEELARQIKALKVTSWMDKPINTDVQTSTGIASPGEPRTLLDRYRLDNLIAEGGFAQVWRGFDLELQRIVAVKVPKPSRLQSADSFMAEARRVARLKHPGIVPVYDVGREGDFCFIVSEFVEGGSLGDHLVNSPPSQQQAVRWIIEIADALEYAHLHGVIHRDIKPANILIDHHNRALLADFGIAQSANKAGQEALSLGTLRYMSPEQLEGKPVDPHADIFSLGIVLHETLTGKLPYSSDEPNVLRREIVSGAKLGMNGLPTELKRICQKALEHDPQHRHTSAAHFAADLRRFLGTPVASRWPWILIVFVTLTLLASGMFFVWMNNKPVAKQENQKTKTGEPAVVPEKPHDQPKKQSLTASELIDQGKALFDQSYFDRAAEKFTEALKVDPNNAEAYDKRGACLFNDGEFKASLVDYDKAIELAPKNPEFLKHRGMAYTSLRNFDTAIADLEQGLKMNPPDPVPYRETLAIIYSNRAAERSKAEKYPEAADDVTQAIKHFPQANVFYHQRGSCYFNMKEYEKALVDFTEAIRREPTKASHYLHRGYCLQALGRQQEADADFDKAKTLGNDK